MAENKTENKDLNSEKSLVETARKRFNFAVDAEAESRALALEDLEFRAGNQWPSDVIKSRTEDRRPCLTINRIPQFIRQITNDQRQNRPSIKVNPVDNKADVDTAKILQGIIRHIEYNSNADVAYDTAFESAATAGLGYFRVITDYASPDSFDQELLIKRIRNRFSVYMDPTYQEPDGSDANWCFIFEDMTEDEYKATYPKSKLCNMDAWRSIGDDAPGWGNEKTARVAEYFYKEFKNVNIFQLSDGSVLREDEMPEALPLNVTVLKTREASIPVVKWCKINGIEVLEETEWLGQWIPVIPVLGDELDVNGKRILEGIVRHAKDPQRMYNYWASSETETISLAPRTPFIGAEGQFEGHEAQWNSANIKNHAFLQYKPVTIGGVQVAPPQRNVFEAPIQAITQARMQSSEDMKATTGIYDAGLGNRSNESSGVAIQRRANQSQTANFHYVDNLSRSLRHLGRVLLELIPKVYDAARVVRIVGEDDSQEVVLINEMFQKAGDAKIYQLGKGKYDVTISNGPSYATKRQEALQSMLSLTQSYPRVAEAAGDLMIKNMDWPGAQEIAERVKKTIPPEITSGDGESGEKQVPPQVQAQMQQMNVMIEQLTQKLNESQDVIKNKTLELQSKERIEYAKIEADMRKELLKISANDYLAEFDAEIQQLDQKQKLENQNPIDGLTRAMSTGQEQQQSPIGGFSPSQPME